MDPTKITLHCPKCGRTQEVQRDDTDPPNASTVELECDRHDSGFETIHYFDSNGNELHVGPK